MDLEEKLARRTVTTGCGQGTVFSCTIDMIYDSKVPQVEVRQSLIYDLLREIGAYNEIYRQAGAVHGCALCEGTRILSFVEDVGRHNAADAIAGQMWLDDIEGADKIFYTTGRLTSEIVMKVTQMGIPVLLSRSGVTHMGLELAEITGVTMIARAKARHFLVYSGDFANVVFDAPPPPRPQRASGNALSGRPAAETTSAAEAVGRRAPPDHQRPAASKSEHRVSTQRSPTGVDSFFQKGACVLRKSMTNSQARNASPRCDAAAATSTMGSPGDSAPTR